MNKLKFLSCLLFAVILATSCSSDKKANEVAKDVKKKQEGKFLPYEKILYPTGEVQMAGKIVKGKRNGPWSSWFKNGKINSEATFVNDQMDGPYQVWYENGQVRIQGAYNMDKEVGTWYFYGEKGDTLKVINYDSVASPQPSPKERELSAK